MHACMHAYIHTYIHTHIHTYMHACMHACIHTYIEREREREGKRKNLIRSGIYVRFAYVMFGLLGGSPIFCKRSFTIKDYWTSLGFLHISHPQSHAHYIPRCIYIYIATFYKSPRYRSMDMNDIPIEISPSYHIPLNIPLLSLCHLAILSTFPRSSPEAHQIISSVRKAEPRVGSSGTVAFFQRAWPAWRFEIPTGLPKKGLWWFTRVFLVFLGNDFGRNMICFLRWRFASHICKCHCFRELPLCFPQTWLEVSVFSWDKSIEQWPGAWFID